jgi:hypothetical protein
MNFFFEKDEARFEACLENVMVMHNVDDKKSYVKRQTNQYIRNNHFNSQRRCNREILFHLISLFTVGK